MENFRIEYINEEPFDDVILRSWKEFTPFRDEFIEFISLLCRYKEDEKLYWQVHEFFQQMLKYNFEEANGDKCFQ